MNKLTVCKNCKNEVMFRSGAFTENMCGSDKVRKIKYDSNGKYTTYGNTKIINKDGKCSYFVEIAEPRLQNI